MRSDNEVRGLAKQVAKQIIESGRAELFITLVDQELRDCDVGCNPYYRDTRVGERRGEQCARLLTKK